MNSNRGIFEAFPEEKGTQTESPFQPANEPAAGGFPASPFSVAPESASPFAKVGESASPRQPEPGKPAKLPERRKSESPFMMAEPPEGFGFDAPAPSPVSSPFTAAAAPKTNVPSPFSIEAPVTPPASPPPANPLPQWGQSTPAAQAPPAITPAAQPPAQPAAQPSTFISDSSSIRQLELRAIFGVDRELGADEILQRARSLPGIRGIVRVGQAETAAIESLKNLVPLLGLSGPLKLYAGNSFVEFVREGSVLLAVQTDRGFAPGVRETLIIVARELGRLG